MDKTNITVTMPVTEYEHLKYIEQAYNEHIKMLERANPDGCSAVFTEELQQQIKEIYC